jgi:hypothetical protein
MPLGWLGEFTTCVNSVYLLIKQSTNSTLTPFHFHVASQVVCPGGLVSIIAYVKHPGGLEEYATVKTILEGLHPIAWTTSEVKLLNRSTAPILLLAWKASDT